MTNQNLFEALSRVCNFTATEDELQEIIDAVEKDKVVYEDPCPNNTHDWVEVYYGNQCSKCGMFFPHGGAPWDNNYPESFPDIVFGEFLDD